MCSPVNAVVFSNKQQELEGRKKKEEEKKTITCSRKHVQSNKSHTGHVHVQSTLLLLLMIYIWLYHLHTLSVHLIMSSCWPEATCWPRSSLSSIFRSITHFRDTHTHRCLLHCFIHLAWNNPHSLAYTQTNAVTLTSFLLFLVCSFTQHPSLSVFLIPTLLANPSCGICCHKTRGTDTWVLQGPPAVQPHTHTHSQLSLWSDSTDL